MAFIPTRSSRATGRTRVLAHAFRALLGHNGPLLFPDITYGFYRSYCGLFAIPFREVPLDSGLRINIEDYVGSCGAIIIANPNAPTGIALPAPEIERLLAAHPDQVVVVDEAYVDFGGESAIPLVIKYPNLLVVQTFSKSRALAGLRVGFAVGQRHLIEGLERVRDSFNSYPLDRPALAGASASWSDVEWFERHRRRIIDDRERLAADLMAMSFEAIPSAANFLFVRHPSADAAQLAQALRDRAILVRHFSGPRTREYLRISIGTEEECRTLRDALREILV